VGDEDRKNRIGRRGGSNLKDMTAGKKSPTNNLRTKKKSVKSATKSNASPGTHVKRKTNAEASSGRGGFGKGFQEGLLRGEQKINKNAKGRIKPNAKQGN